ncbi:MAG: CDP-diacylglycerol--serine O-phosphatidyltransferase [Bacteroides sp.]|nr:CDP-diacylglycerol--serine O-phosphatidyltransferase [Bacteroidales bacterium]MBD5303514.1 CDP-diacylglycerol--serine O-phosphatidyltransferase [Bacteroides sp.]
MITKYIPNSITCLNIASGCVATIFALQGDALIGGMAAYNWAFIFIGIAAVMDFLDGFAARLLHAYSDMGKELDSLCDCVSFGVAPAMLLYATLAPQGGWIPWLAILIPVAGALRLAKFNIDTRQTTSFIGLPIPANAIFWIGYTAYCHAGFSNLTLPFIVVPVVILESWLMLSPLKLFSLKFHTWGWKGNGFRWLLIATAIASVVIFGVPGLMWLIIAYLVYGILDRGKTV